MTRENVRKAKNADKNAKKAAAKKASKNAAAGKANPVGNGYSAANASYNTAGTGYSQTGNQSYSYTSSSMQQSSRPVKKKKKFGKFLVGFVIIAAFAASLVERSFMRFRIILKTIHMMTVTATPRMIRTAMCRK